MTIPSSSTQPDVFIPTSVSESPIAISQTKSEVSPSLNQSIDKLKEIISELSSVPDTSKRRAITHHRKAE